LHTDKIGANVNIAGLKTNDYSAVTSEYNKSTAFYVLKKP
jgi:hypothetical protein